MAEQMERNVAIMQHLIDAGCNTEIVERFFELQVLGKDMEQIKLLNVHRRSLLDKIHKEQKHLDCLDYLLYQLCKKKESVGAAP